jgi:hypothetical protein
LLVETPTGKCATQLRMHSDIYLRMMRGMREKIHMADNASLIAWAKERIKGGFSRPLFRESTDVFSHRNPSASWQELSSNRRPIITASAVERLLATAPIDAKAYPTSGFALISLLR